MKINYLHQRKDVPTKEIMDFEKEIGIELVVTERKDTHLPRFYARFDACEVKNGIILTGSYGFGNTVDEAIENYCKGISGELLVYQAASPTQRREFKVPNLVYTKRYNLQKEEKPEYPIGTLVVDKHTINIMAKCEGEKFIKKENGYKPYNFCQDILIPHHIIEKEIGSRFEIIKEEKPEYPKILSFMSDGKVYSYDAFVPDWEYSLDQKHCTIHSVAKSENEVFTVGDVTTDGKIKSFHYDESYCGNIYVLFDRDGIESSIEALEKAHERKPLFTSEDGVKIFEGDEYWFIYLHDGMPVKAWTPYSTKTSSSNIEKKCGSFQFSTREAAEKWIHDNKPEYSRRQIKEALEKKHQIYSGYRMSLHSQIFEQLGITDGKTR